MAALLPGKFIYLALPHTATCATLRALYNGVEDCYVSRIWEVGKVPPERGLDSPKNNRSTHHLSLAEVRERRPELFQGGEIAVSTVRHPCDLLVTWWLRQKDTISKRWKVPEPTFPEYIEFVDEDTPGGPYIKGGRMFWMEADHYLRYESLQTDLDAFLAQLGLLTTQLEKQNVTKNKKPWRTYYDEATLSLVRHRFGEEAARFGYEV